MNKTHQPHAVAIAVLHIILSSLLRCEVLLSPPLNCEKRGSGRANDLSKS